MKTFSILIGLGLLVGSTLQAQQQSEDAKKLNILVGGSFAKPKIIPALEKFALAQLTVNYKLNSTVTTVTREKGTGEIAGAKLTAYLETTDGELTEADFQEVTDHFYAYFQKQLKSNGIDTVAWSTIASTEFYQQSNEKVADNAQEKNAGGVWVTHNANKGNSLYGGGIAFAFGKIKQASRFCEEIGAPAGFFHVTVDFADIWVNLDIKSKTSAPFGYVGLERTTSYKYEAAANPDLRVAPTNLGNTMLWNEKSQAETIVVQQSIDSKMPYHTSISRDPSRLGPRLFAFAKAMDPVIILTTRAQYKAAAKKALEKYADAFVSKTVYMKAGGK